MRLPSIETEGVCPRSRYIGTTLAALYGFLLPRQPSVPPRATSSRLGRSPRAPTCGLHRAAVPHGAHGAWKRHWAAVPAGPVAAPRVPPTSQAASRLVWCPASHATQRRVRRARQLGRLSALRRAPRGSRPLGRRFSPQVGARGLLRYLGCPRTASPMADRRGSRGVVGLRPPRRSWHMPIGHRLGCARSQRGCHARTASSSTKSRNRPYSGAYASLTSPQDP